MSIKIVNKNGLLRAHFGGFCYEVFPTLGSLYQAANANCESFAFTLFCFFDWETPILTASTLPDCPFPYS